MINNISDIMVITVFITSELHDDIGFIIFHVFSLKSLLE